MTGNKGIT